MPVQLHNTLTKRVNSLTPLNEGRVGVYSCGPTVYDHAHIGNLSAFVMADTLRRVIAANGYQTVHVMNVTDIDDKTIRRSREEYPDMAPLDALRTSTRIYTDLFMDDMKAIGNDVDALTFIRATDDATIEGMRQLITNLYDQGFAYIADDGVYFSIEAYQKSGKTYGQLVEINAENTSASRIANDEYDKESVHDFALWKVEKSGEPAWDFNVGGKTLRGRPGWHIECSVMSQQGLGVPFDIHTGGIDLAFPHHENEIAQSTAGNSHPTYASMFVHNEHILVDGRKMSKSLGNFYTLQDLIDKGVDPLAFRLLVLQSHYRNQTNFSFDNVQAATNRLRNWRAVAALRHQIHETIKDKRARDHDLHSPLAAKQAIIEALSVDLDTPTALRIIDETFDALPLSNIDLIYQHALASLIETIDDVLGLHLAKSTPDISDDAKQLIIERERARDAKDWALSDILRDRLLHEYHLTIRDTSHGSVWSYAD